MLVLVRARSRVSVTCSLVFQRDQKKRRKPAKKEASATAQRPPTSRVGESILGRGFTLSSAAPWGVQTIHSLTMEV